MNSCDRKSPDVRWTITAPVCKAEVQLATDVPSSSQGSMNVPCVSHSRDDVEQQQLICSSGKRVQMVKAFANGIYRSNANN